MIVVALSICASAVGVSVALMYGVRNRFPLYALLASAQDNRTTGYDVTPAIGSDDGGGEMAEEGGGEREEKGLCDDERDCGVGGDGEARVVDLYVLNLGVCHSNELLVGADFQRRFHYFYYALFTACLLAMSLFYATIHRSASPRCSSMQLATCSVPIQPTRCRFPVLAISGAEI